MPPPHDWKMSGGFPDWISAETLSLSAVFSRTKPAEAAEGSHADRPKKRQDSYQPWKSGAQNTRGFGKVSVPRKVGSG